MEYWDYKPKRKKQLGFTNSVVKIVVVEDIVVTGACLLLCAICIMNGFTGSLPFFSALIGLQQAKSAVIVTAATNKSKKENTRGGVNYEKMRMEAQKTSPVNYDVDC